MTSERPAILFHVPYPLNPNATSGSGIRPYRMRLAFEQLGYQVWEISGQARARAAAMRRVRKAVRDGVRFAFAYSESSTLPNMFAGPTRVPHPLLEARFFAFCRRHRIPLGVFYRDVYWRQARVSASAAGLRTLVFRLGYLLDLVVYRALVDRIYLPSMDMADRVPLLRKQSCVALPPGSDVVDSAVPDDPATLFYVGGLGEYYRLQACVGGVGAVPEAGLVICTRPEQWQRCRGEYEPLPAGVSVVHAEGSGLERYFDRAAIGVLFMEPIPYRQFASPLKLYEYLAHGKPVIATEGSLSARVVEGTGTGWVLPYEPEALRQLLIRLREDPSEYEAARRRVLQVRLEHTWQARAGQAADDLGASR